MLLHHVHRQREPFQAAQAALERLAAAVVPLAVAVDVVALTEPVQMVRCLPQARIPAAGAVAVPAVQ